MPFFLLLLISALAGLGAAFLARRYPGSHTPSAVVEAARRSRLDPEKATGLALTLALAAIFVGGVALALLASAAPTRSPASTAASRSGETPTGVPGRTTRSPSSPISARR